MELDQALMRRWRYMEVYSQLLQKDALPWIVIQPLKCCITSRLLMLPTFEPYWQKHPCLPRCTKFFHKLQVLQRVWCISTNPETKGLLIPDSGQVQLSKAPLIISLTMGVPIPEFTQETTVIPLHHNPCTSPLNIKFNGKTTPQSVSINMEDQGIHHWMEPPSTPLFAGFVQCILHQRTSFYSSSIKAARANLTKNHRQRTSSKCDLTLKMGRFGTGTAPIQRLDTINSERTVMDALSLTRSANCLLAHQR